MQPPGGTSEQGKNTPRRAVAVFACIATGMLIARGMPAIPSPMWFSLACLACAVGGLTRGRACVVALVLAAVAFGGGWWTCRIAEQPRDPLWELMDTVGPGDGPQDLVLSLEGIALDEPRGEPGSGAMSEFAQRGPYGRFRLSVTGLKTDHGWVGVSAIMSAQARGTTWDATRGLGGFGIHAGDRVRVTARAEPTQGPMNPGEPDRRLIAIQNEESGSIRIDSPSLIEPAAGAGSALAAARSWWLHSTTRLRATSEKILDPGRIAPNEPQAAIAADRARALLGSLFLGVREPGEPQVRAQFTRLGLAHVLAISGFHVTVAVSAALLLVRLTGDRGRLEPLLVAALIGTYMVLVPADAPVVRAAIVLVVILLSRGLGRRYDDLNTLAWAGVGLLLWRPMDLWSLGFQLSLGLTALLLWRGREFHERVFGAPILGLARAGAGEPMIASVLGAMKRLCSRTLSAGLMCWLASMPLIAVTTGMFSPLAALTGLVVLPLVVVLMWAGYGLLVAGLIAAAFSVDISGWTTAVLSPLAALVVRTVGWLDTIPGTSFMWPPMSVWWGAGATIAALVWIVRGSVRDRASWAAAIVVGTWGIGEYLWPRVGARRERAELCELSLTGGSCAVLQSAGEAILWNCGGSPDSAGRTILRASRELGVHHARAVVIAGEDLACFAALPDVCLSLGVREVWIAPGLTQQAEHEPTGAAAWVLEWLRSTNIDVRVAREGDGVRFGAATVRLSLCGAEARVGDRFARAITPALLGLLSVEAVGVGHGNGTARALLANELVDRNSIAFSGRHGDFPARVALMPRRTPASVVSGTLVERTGAEVLIGTVGRAPRGRGDPAVKSTPASVALFSVREHGAVRATLDADGRMSIIPTRGGAW